MRRNVTLALATAVSLAAASQVYAGIQVNIVPAPNFLNTAGTTFGTNTNINPTLAANGWSAYIISLTATSAGGHLVTIQLQADEDNLFGGTVGLIGKFHQNWSPNDPPNPPTHTPSSNAGNNESTALGTPNRTTTGWGTDSVFINPDYFSVKFSPSEDNNEIDQPGTPNQTSNYNHSPLDDGNPGQNVPGGDFGVGALMQVLETTDNSAGQAAATANIAYVIVPTNGNNSFVRGYAVETVGNTNTKFNFNVLINPSAAVPEPASLGLLTLGGLGLLAKRRRPSSQKPR